MIPALRRTLFVVWSSPDDDLDDFMEVVHRYAQLGTTVRAAYRLQTSIVSHPEDDFAGDLSVFEEEG